MKAFTIFSVLLLICLIGCGKQGEEKGPSEDIARRKIRAVATTGMIADAVQNVGGERIEVTALMGSGVDPHLYKASEGDVSRMFQADIIFYNGLHLEGKMSEIFEKMRTRIKTAAVTDKIDRALLQAPPEFAGNYDPHVWFDVTLWMKVVEYIAEVLSEFDPTHATVYQANAERYLAELSTLHAYMKQQAAKVAPEKRVLITAHDAFNYFGRAYGFEVRGLQGISTTAEAGTADVQELAKFIIIKKIPAIFVETSVPPRFIQALQAAVKAEGFEVRIGGSLFSDAMGNPGTPEGRYPGMIRHNIDTIVGALLAGV